jgi:branched-chain amino acid transport system ATP-binding protein
MALLEVSGLTKRFGGLTAINDLNFSIERGELLSIIGPNGSGKTTFFSLLTGTFRPTTGAIIFDGHDVTRSKPHQAARFGIGRTFQKTTVFKAGTVLDNVIIGECLHADTGVLKAILRPPSTRITEQRVREKARDILSFVGLVDKENVMADGLTEEAQKRLSIAMALAIEPKLLLLDEPTGGVNLEEIDGLMALIEKVRDSGITVCLIEHKMRMVMSISERVLVLSYGLKIAEGKPEEVAKNEEVIKAYLGGRYAA